ncbi:MAG: Type IV pilus biogenesis/stability protein PilW [uncultured Thiotrichaceae bacterium]|uniref:Type IV pilus biogenesis/stability protein PilW n=1 Tax=uncultured Thiotrichaceae bacterium TaxID=298394 RepID=A0A6S6UB38_9GAMM|nr:MAG: Type IV pilus biogenesis/stability protein PilW [uncultured Thiotrichaceae bacterium]
MLKVISSTILYTAFISFLVGCSSTPQSKPEEAAGYNARLGAQYLQKGHLRLANEKLLKALEQDEYSAEANHYYALLQERLKQDLVAEKHFKRAISEKPKDPEINNNYGTFLCKMKDYPAAEKHFLRAIKDPLYSTPEFALTNAGICAHESGHLSQAEDFLRRALKKKQNFPSALYAMAKLAYHRRDYARAQAFLFRYNGIAEQSANALSLCHAIHVQLGEIAKADECGNRLLEQFPNSSEALSLK